MEAGAVMSVEPRVDGAHGFPAPVLTVSDGGTVTESNGRLEADLDREIVGQVLDELLDPSCRGKWRRTLAAPEELPARLELIFAHGDPTAEPRRFVIFREPDRPGLRLLQLPADMRLDELRTQVIETNTELSQTQRELHREKAQLARALDELERANEELEAFAHVVSHELRAPLRAIRNYAAWIVEDLGTDVPEAVQGHVGLLHARVGRMERLIRAILTYSRAGRDGGEAGPVDVAALVDEAVAMLTPQTDVRIDVVTPLPTVHAQHVQFEQVLMNLLANAVRHAASRVTVASYDRDELVEFRIEDDGPGVPDGMRERIWELFRTGDPESGSGIGLATVRKLVELNGGTADVDKAEGGGASFRFTWPRLT